jgi:hypothetical protein
MFYSVCSETWTLKLDDCLMFIPFIITCSKNKQHMHWIVLLLYSIYRLLHVSAVVCHHQGASWICLIYWNADQMGGISYNISLCGLCAGVLCFHLLCFLVQLESTTNGTITLWHTDHINLYYMIYHLFDLHFK